MSSFVCLFCNLEMESLSSAEVGHNILTLTSTWQGKMLAGEKYSNIFGLCWSYFENGGTCIFLFITLP